MRPYVIESNRRFRSRCVTHVLLAATFVAYGLLMQTADAAARHFTPSTGATDLYPFNAGQSLSGQWTLIRQYGPDETPNGIEELTPGPDGKLYGGNAQGQVFLVDPVDGGLTLVSELTGDALLAMAEGPDGRLYSATAPAR